MSDNPTGKEGNFLMATKKKTKKKGSDRSFILTLALVAIIVYFTISLVSLQIQINQKKQEVEAAKITLSEVQSENEDLKVLQDMEDDESYMEKIARDVLGYVLPGESVYYDVSTGN